MKNFLILLGLFGSVSLFASSKDLRFGPEGRVDEINIILRKHWLAELEPRYRDEEILVDLATKFVSDLKTLSHATADGTKQNQAEAKALAKQMTELVLTVSENQRAPIAPNNQSFRNANLIKSTHYSLISSSLAVVAYEFLNRILGLPFGSENSALVIAPIAFLGVEVGLYEGFFHERVASAIHRQELSKDYDLIVNRKKYPQFKYVIGKYATFHTDYQMWMPFWNTLRIQGLELPEHYWDYREWLLKLTASAYDQRAAQILSRIEKRKAIREKCVLVLEQGTEVATQTQEHQLKQIEESDSLVQQNLQDLKKL